jgi:adenosylmethionine-8-amino-7-oxononanoate aminotransferase
MNGYGTSLCGIPPNLEGYNGPIIDEVHVVDRNSVDEIRELFERSGDSIAAFIGEPVIGAGGVYPPEPDYWPQIERLCREHDVLLICDEVICAFGRLGAWFGCQVYGFTPDLITCAKGLTSGYLPLGAVITSGEFAAPFWDDPDAPVLRHGYTYSGHPAACVAALANLDIIEREGLVERVAELAPWYAELIHATFDDLDIVAEARAVGLLAAVEIRGDLVAADPGLPLRVTAECRNQGLISRAIGASLQISPSLVATKEEITAMIDRLKAALDIVAADLVLAGDQA